jgi:hypothetical protein
MLEIYFNRTPVEYLVLAIQTELDMLLNIKGVKIAVGLHGSEITGIKIATKTVEIKKYIENNLVWCPFLSIIKPGLISVEEIIHEI